MKVLYALFFLLISQGIAPAQNNLKNIQRVSVSGSEYFRLKDWAGSAGFDVRWVTKDEELQLANRGWKLRFSINSLKAAINGMDVRLSLPVLLRNGVVYISASDVQSTLQPIFYPPKNGSSNQLKLICLDAGHGGKDKGKIDRNNFEKKFTLLLVEELARQLKQNNFQIVTTRRGDETLDLSQRCDTANRAGADLFISLHFNAADNRAVRGVETYCLTPAGMESSNGGGGTSHTGNSNGNAQNSKNMLLAYEVHRAILKEVQVADRGLKRARFEVLRDVRMPAVLIEGGFMTNPGEAKKIYDPAYRKKLASAIVDGILTYKKVVEPVAAPVPSKDEQVSK